jgi:hypothetical protein
MKAIKILGTIVGVIVAAVLIFWLGWLRAPSPESVCDHMSEVLEKEAGVALPEADKQDCMRRFQPPEFGRMPYVQRMKCVKNAESLDAIDKCE